MADIAELTVAAGNKTYLSRMVRESVEQLSRGDSSKDEIINAIQFYVRFCSKARHRGSITMLACLLDSYNKAHDDFDCFAEPGSHCTKFVGQAFNRKYPSEAYIIDHFLL